MFTLNNKEYVMPGRMDDVLDALSRHLKTQEELNAIITELRNRADDHYAKIKNKLNTISAFESFDINLTKE